MIEKIEDRRRAPYVMELEMKARLNEVIEVLNRHLGEKLQIHVPFPSSEIEMY